jgi:hypothetical protein
LPDPCTPDCESTPWDSYPPLHYTSSRCPNCDITVYYKARYACGLQDIQILRIQKGPMCFSSCTDEMVYQDALGAIIYTDAMGFDPQNGIPGTSTMWRVISGSCWADWTKYILDSNNNVIDSVAISEPCYQSICCIEPITVTRFADNSVQLTVQNSNYDDSLDCKDAYTWNPYTDDSLFCHPVCHWIPRINNFNWGGVTGGVSNPGTIVITPYNPGTQKIITNQNTIPNDDDLNYYAINTYQTSNNLNINIKSSLEKEMILKIFDLNGKEVKSINYQLNKGLNTYSIDLSQFITGIYIYSISIDGFNLKANKVTIIH